MNIVVIQVKRNWKYYFWHVAFLSMVLMSLMPIVFRFSSISDQFGAILTMLLASIALLYVIEPNMPKLKFLTILDKYILSNFMFAFSVSLQVFILDFNEATQFARNYAMFFNWGLWLLI